MIWSRGFNSCLLLPSFLLSNLINDNHYTFLMHVTFKILATKNQNSLKNFINLVKIQNFPRKRTPQLLKFSQKTSGGKEIVSGEMVNREEDGSAQLHIIFKFSSFSSFHFLLSRKG